MLPWIVTALLLGCVTEALFILLESRTKMLSALVFKGTASLLFVLAGTMAAGIAPNERFAHLVVIGLALGAVGDVCLNLRFLLPERATSIFLLGIAAFLSGHIAYLVALITHAPGALIYALPAAAVLAFFVIRFVLLRVNVSGLLKLFGIVYLCVVVFMAVYATVLFALLPQSAALALFAVGGLLFAVSDVLLVLHQFGRQSHPAFRALNLSLYYVGQVCIALSIALLR